MDVGLDAFERIIFGRRHDLGGRCMNDIIDALHCALNALAITNIADDEFDILAIFILLGHVPLLHFIA